MDERLTGTKYGTVASHHRSGRGSKRLASVVAAPTPLSEAREHIPPR